jgi:UDP:flavonoid glycosyltransferase YjiC (YdhE family)
MRALLTTYGSRGAVDPVVGLAAELVAAQFDAVAAAAEECHAPVATGVMPTGAWR